jgi:hypothetical protein
VQAKKHSGDSTQGNKPSDSTTAAFKLHKRAQEGRLAEQGQTVGVGSGKQSGQGKLSPQRASKLQERGAQTHPEAHERTSHAVHEGQSPTEHAATEQAEVDHSTNLGADRVKPRALAPTL